MCQQSCTRYTKDRWTNLKESRVLARFHRDGSKSRFAEDRWLTSVAFHSAVPFHRRFRFLRGLSNVDSQIDALRILVLPKFLNILDQTAMNSYYDLLNYRKYNIVQQRWLRRRWGRFGWQSLRAPTRWRIACNVTPADGGGRTGKLLRFVDDRFLLDNLDRSLEIGGLGILCRKRRVQPSKIRHPSSASMILKFFLLR